MEVETSTVLTSTPHDSIPHQPVDDDTKCMLIAPLVIPSRSPKPSSLPTTTSAEQPSLLTCYAGLFARLPSLGQIMNSQFAHAQELYNHLFAPSTPVFPPIWPTQGFFYPYLQSFLRPRRLLCRSPLIIGRRSQHVTPHSPTTCLIQPVNPTADLYFHFRPASSIFN